MKIISIILVLGSINVLAYGQGVNAEQKDVLRVIDQLFEGMKSADSSMVRTAFTADVQMFTVFTDRDGAPVIHKGSMMDFLKAVGSPHDQIWSEEIWNSEVRIDGNFAQIWTQYAFYAGKEFSHCGVDAFHLFKSKEGWKIFHLTDTRNWQHCKVPEEVQEKFK